MIARLRNQSGQALVVTLVFATVMLGAAALTLDVGSWYREHRQAQTTADAAALAGAQSLPGNTSGATTVAQTYAGKNGGGILATGGIVFGSDSQGDTVTVKVQRTAPGFFSKLFGIDSVNVYATATARSAVPVGVTGAAPIVVQKDHPALSGAACPGNGGHPCFGQQTSIPLNKNGAPGAFDLVDLSAGQVTDPTSGQCSKTGGGGNQGSSTVAAWIQSGYSGSLPLGCYQSDTGAKFNSNSIEDAMNVRQGSVLLFPVYDLITNTGSGANYRVIGWAAFDVTGSFAPSGRSGEIDGYFTSVIWDGIESSTGSAGSPDYGVRSIALVN
jgi:Flp pilus assembly protein TadG